MENITHRGWCSGKSDKWYPHSSLNSPFSTLAHAQGERAEELNRGTARRCKWWFKEDVLNCWTDHIEVEQLTPEMIKPSRDSSNVRKSKKKPLTLSRLSPFRQKMSELLIRKDVALCFGCVEITRESKSCGRNEEHAWSLHMLSSPLSLTHGTVAGWRWDSGGTVPGQRWDSGGTVAGQRWDSGGTAMLFLSQSAAGGDHHRATPSHFHSL